MHNIAHGKSIVIPQVLQHVAALTDTVHSGSDGPEMAPLQDGLRSPYSQPVQVNASTPQEHTGSGCGAAATSVSASTWPILKDSEKRQLGILKGWRADKKLKIEEESRWDQNSKLSAMHQCISMHY